jgi:glycosyltransferase involved in cell wall biosynthesis
MRAAVVLPCFNEELMLAQTCESLGFGVGCSFPIDDVCLIIVDNNSSDSTPIIAKQIQSSSRNGTVFIVKEMDRGFVQARNCGNCYLIRLAKENGFNLKDILVVQADADTLYCNDYISLIYNEAQSLGHNVLFEAAVGYPSSFINKFPDYVQLCKNIDSEFMAISPDELELDVIVDDKVSAYWLSDYLFWGGHKKEYTSTGEEVYAETTRLFMKAIGFGAKRLFVENAYAFHSARKLLSDPLIQFATAGFPREFSWSQKWRKNIIHPVEIGEFNFQQTNDDFLRASNCRRAHLFALFKILPLHISRSLKYKENKIDSYYDQLLHKLPVRVKEVLINQPSVLLMDVLNLIVKIEK